MRRPAVLFVIPLALVSLLTGCANSPVAPVVTETAAVATPTPTSEILVVEAGEKPPAVFGGDCAAALPAEAVEAAVGAVAVTVVEDGGAPTIGNAGGISCSWSGTDATGASVGGSVTIFPQTGLGDAAYSASTYDFYFVDCEGYWCAWHSREGGLEITGSSGGQAALGRAATDAQGAAIAAAIVERYGDEQWERDRTGWWPADACASLAAGLGDVLGGPVAAAIAGYHDPPMPGPVLADLASHMSWCGLSAGEEYSEDLYLAEVRLDAGTAWSVPGEFTAVPVPVSSPGVEAYTVEEPFGYAGYSPGAVTYVITDGINVMQLSVPAGAPWSAADVLDAAAAWVAGTASQP